MADRQGPWNSSCMQPARLPRFRFILCKISFGRFPFGQRPFGVSFLMRRIPCSIGRRRRRRNARNPLRRRANRTHAHAPRDRPRLRETLHYQIRSPRTLRRRQASWFFARENALRSVFYACAERLKARSRWSRKTAYLYLPDCDRRIHERYARHIKISKWEKTW